MKSRKELFPQTHQALYTAHYNSASTPATQPEPHLIVYSEYGGEGLNNGLKKLYKSKSIIYLDITLPLSLALSLAWLSPGPVAWPCPCRCRWPCP